MSYKNAPHSQLGVVLTRVRTSPKFRNLDTSNKNDTRAKFRSGFKIPIYLGTFNFPNFKKALRQLRSLNLGDFTLRNSMKLLTCMYIQKLYVHMYFQIWE